jgi:hypothetical protein
VLPEKNAIIVDLGASLDNAILYVTVEQDEIHQWISEYKEEGGIYIPLDLWKNESFPFVFLRID